MRIEGVFHHAAVEVEHLHAPVLAAVQFVGLFAHDARVVLARVTVAQDEFGLCHGADAVGEVHVEARLFGAYHFEVGVFVALGLRLREEHECRAFSGHGHVGTVGGHEQERLAGRFGFPELGLVRTVVLAGLHGVRLGAYGEVAEGVDEAPRARELAHHEVRAGLAGVEFLEGKFALRVERHDESLGGQAQVVECPFFVTLGLGGHEAEEAEEKEGKEMFHVFHDLVLREGFGKGHPRRCGDPAAGGVGRLADFAHHPVDAFYAF